ncbi:restriction endonuclease subunit S [Methylicorpusculum oleiharenae]|uniref:restriction endonuclease subunit S n=1 Tax=Methylicorpusculum oleiharenae TaxID=1338687 RepID=UPI00135BFFE9|nr:restriction endonuclease subunit S [Methylicorpusculum oleiharenae]MCD2449003.1 restriction endonuclease subunit S [Methylicorpusculum oleiharenae]
MDLKNLDKSNWQTYRFDQIAKNISERVDPNNTGLKVYIGLEHIDSESIHIKRTGSPDDVNGQKLRCYPGDVIFGRRRAYQRKAAIATIDGFCSAHALVLRANPEVIDPQLFPFFLHSDAFMHRAVDISVGSLSPTINWGTLKHQEFLLPPKDHQAKLAELLWAMDAVVEKEMSLLVSIELLRDTNREKLYTYGLDALKNENTTNLKVSKCGLIRNDLLEKKFFDCVEITIGQVDPKVDKYSKLYQIGSERIEPNTGQISELKTAKELNISSGNYLFTEEDVIYSKIRPYFKKVANPNFTGLCSADIYPLRPKDKSLSKEFLFCYLLTEKFTRRLLRFQNRTGMPKVNRDELSSMYIPLPCRTPSTVTRKRMPLLAILSIWQSYGNPYPLIIY